MNLVVRNWLGALLLVLSGCIPVSSVNLFVAASGDISADLAAVERVFLDLGFNRSALADGARKDALGFDAFRGQFTVVAPEPERKRISIYFAERSDSFSPEARAAYAKLRNALALKFGAQRVEGPVTIGRVLEPNPALNTDAERPQRAG